MTFALTHAHTHDPDTSRWAAETARGLTYRHKLVVETILGLYGPLTSAEISDRCKLDYWQVARRISDLKRDGKVLDSSERRRSPGGRSACVWRLV